MITQTLNTTTVCANQDTQTIYFAPEWSFKLLDYPSLTYQIA